MSKDVTLGVMGISRNFCRRAKFHIVCAGTNEVAENKDKTVKHFDVSIQILNLVNSW